MLKLEGEQLFKCFVDLKKAYDNVHMELMWPILFLYGIPGNLVQVIRGLHDGAEAEGVWHTISQGKNWMWRSSK